MGAAVKQMSEQPIDFIANLVTELSKQQAATADIEQHPVYFDSDTDDTDLMVCLERVRRKASLEKKKPSTLSSAMTGRQSRQPTTSSGINSKASDTMPRVDM